MSEWMTSLRCLVEGDDVRMVHELMCEIIVVDGTF